MWWWCLGSGYIRGMAPLVNIKCPKLVLPYSPLGDLAKIGWSIGVQGLILLIPHLDTQPQVMVKWLQNNTFFLNQISHQLFFFFCLLCVWTIQVFKTSPSTLFSTCNWSPIFITQIDNLLHIGIARSRHWLEQAIVQGSFFNCLTEALVSSHSKNSLGNVADAYFANCNIF